MSQLMNNWYHFVGGVDLSKYMPSKPDKYGMKFFWECDSKSSFSIKEAGSKQILLEI